MVYKANKSDKLSNAMYTECTKQLLLLRCGYKNIKAIESYLQRIYYINYIFCKDVNLQTLGKILAERF